MRSQSPESPPTSEARGGEAGPTEPYIPRRLRRRIHDEDVLIADDHVLDLEGPIVVLGEPGMGKTTLMRRLAERAGTSRVRARTFARESGGGAGKPIDPGRLVIDALDEMPAAREGDAVDAVLRRLGRLGHPPFVLSCRVADWRSATAVREIEDEYGQAPIELFLEPLGRAEAEAFLSWRLGAEEARRLVEHFAALGPEELLGNPQNLVMIEAVGSRGELPTTRGELYDRAAAGLWHEHRRDKTDEPLGDLNEATALDAAGAAFAALLLTGREAISRAPSGAVGEGAVHVGDVRRLPGADAVDAVLGSRLFRAAGQERFAPLHRTVAEHLGARWLARVASTPRRRRRLLALIRPDGLVPASLRGLHAWLVRAPEMAAGVIAADPLGVVLHGDPDRLTEGQARTLLDGLRSLDRWNRGFQVWGQTPSMDALFRPGLLPEVRALIRDRGEGAGLRHLVLGALRDRAAAEALREELLALVLDPEEVFVVRHDAIEALARCEVVGMDWTGLAAHLNGLGGSEDLRLAIDLMRIVGSASFSDEEIAQYVAASARDASKGRVGATLSILAMSIPADRAPDILDRLAREELPDGDRRDGAFDLHRFVERLLEAWLAEGGVDPIAAWRWIRVIGTNVSDLRAGKGVIADWLRGDEDARRRIQRHVLLEVEDAKRDRIWRAHEMSRACSTLHPSEDDVVELLRAAGPPPDDEEGTRDWSDLLLLVSHAEGRGSRARAVAREVSGGHPTVEVTIHALENPEVPEWQRRDQERAAREAAEKGVRNAEWRAELGARLDGLRCGRAVGGLAHVAQGYLGHFYDVEDGEGPRGRLVEWIGPEITEVALEGFEALLTGPECPSVLDIEEQQAEGRMLLAEHVVAAALAARTLAGRSLDDLDDERLLVGGMAARSSPMSPMMKDGSSEEGGPLDLTSFVEEEIRRRPGLMERHLRITFEAELVREGKCSHDLHGVMHRDEDAAVATALAEEWLGRFDGLADDIEWYLVARLVQSGRREALLRVAASRSARRWRTDEERRRWTAVEAVFGEGGDPEEEGSARDPNLLWAIRRLLHGEGFEKRTGPALAPRTMAWVVRAFRGLWPNVSRASGPSVGDMNPWDASEHITGMISRLAGETSDEAVVELRALRDAEPDSYTELLRTVAREQAQKRAEERYEPPDVTTLADVLADAPPRTPEDLQAVMLEELDVVQAKLRAHPVDWRRGFFDDAGRPRGEEACRDEVLKVLGDHPAGVDCAPEGHLAQDKRADIACTVGELMLPIEVKGQWHDELWSAAEGQLAPRYATDWRAGGRGIYLVLWFGPGAGKGRIPKAPSRGTPKPASAADLRNALVDVMPLALRERIAVVVLDLTLG